MIGGMKRFLYVVVVGALFFAALGSRAQESQNTPPLTPVAEALSAAKVFNAQPNLKARFYIYLQSASWCVPCCKEMPKIVAAYDSIKAAGGELIYVSVDQEEATARKVLETYKAPFPAVMSPEAQRLPGYRDARRIPDAIFVYADGSAIYNGPGSDIPVWQDFLKI